MPERVPVQVHLLPTLIPPGVLVGSVAVVVDVLRATTVMVHALANGCEAVIPCLEIAEARRLAAALPPGSALLAGERLGLPIEGFDLGNSPGELTPEVCRNRTLVMTTTNGTRTILACLEAKRVFIGAFVNLRPLIRSIVATARPVQIVCSGTDGRISLEDTLLAGALVAHLKNHRLVLDNDSAEIAARLWDDAEARAVAGEPLARLLSQGRGGRRVSELGLGADIQAAAAVDRFDLTAELLRDPLRIVAAGG